MIKIILKNLWHSRGRNGWLFAELILVTILSWAIVDPVAVSISDRYLDLGYDADRLVNISFLTIPEDHPEYSIAEQDSTVQIDNFNKIIRCLENLPEVESAAYVGKRPQINSSSLRLTNHTIGNPAVDTLVKASFILNRYPGHKYFETFGFKSVPGSPSVEELSKLHLSENEIIITRDYANLFWHGENAVGKKLISRININGDNADTTYQTVRGVIEGFRYQSLLRSRCIIFKNIDRIPNFDEFTLTLRIAQDTDPYDFIAGFNPQKRRELAIGNFRFNKIASQESLIESTEFTYGVSSKRKLMSILSVFFLINLILGTTGCFWLQTRRRIAEIGVLRSFGAVKSDIMKMLLGESFILATTAFVIGDFIYLQYALKEGLDIGFINNCSLNLIDNWVNNFWSHFGVVSAIVYALIIICVVIGTLMPAIKMSCINPVDALRDE